MIKHLVLLLALSGLSMTSTALEFYGGLDANYISNEVGPAEFHPLAAGGRIGAYLEPGVGLELHAMTGVNDDKDIDIDSELSYTVGMAARFESPESEGGKIYFLLGYALSELDVSRSGTGKPGTVSFDDFSYGGGLEFRLGKTRKLYMNLQMVRFYSDNGIDLDAVSLGLRAGF